VIGGLLFATAATLLFVPVVFSLAHPRLAAKADDIQDTGEFHVQPA